MKSRRRARRYFAISVFQRHFTRRRSDCISTFSSCRKRERNDERDVKEEEERLLVLLLPVLSAVGIWPSVCNKRRPARGDNIMP